MKDRNDVSYLHLKWTEKETTKLIEVWSTVESSSKIRQPSKFGGIDAHIAALFSSRGSNNRSAGSVHAQRSRLYDAIRFIHRFDEMQAAHGGRLWFDLSKQERAKVRMSGQANNTSLLLTRGSFNTLDTHVRHAVVTKSIVDVKASVCSPENCHSCWSTTEVKSLVRSWVLFMKKTSNSVSRFVSESSAESATSYTPWNHSTASAWRKMKRIATSYLFIQDFDTRYAPAKWFELSDGAQNMWIDWNALPADFEDISRDIYDEIHKVDFPLSSLGKNLYTALPHNCSIPREISGDNSIVLKLDPPGPKLRRISPLLLDFNLTKSPKSTMQACDQHKECNDLYEKMERRQNKQFKRAIRCLRTDIEREFREGADVARAVLFERLGSPGDSGDATFVANLLDDQQRQLRDRFAQFQRDETKVNLFNVSLGKHG
ncbi:hypothetical protein GN244_ATG06927 [Phytophthora infestans]|uniref:Uncharacterized protein n=1 Tax=Phytophthora infestans TaxID=4787 RepID=A0A833TC43_PHYIN|nr:hypothetical protein GN244_ATG06927 [Phytophthora infestans]